MEKMKGRFKMIELKDVCYAYGNEIALRYINLNIQKGESVIIQGPNGCGKSTLEEKPAQSAFKPLYILMAVLIIFTPLGLLASGTAWGEWGVEEMASLVSNGKALGYTPAGMEKGFSLASLFPDYSMAGMPEWIGYILSAVVGVAIIVIFFKLLAGSKKDKIDFSKGQSV
jgi:cobalt/nickel transport system permease protein